MRSGATRFVSAWLAVVALVSIVLGCVEIAVQQSFRTTANDPQIQMAEDAAASEAAALAAVRALRGAGSAPDLGRSLAPWLALYSRRGEPLAASSTLDGNLPQLPAGVFGEAAARGEHRVTWQPRAGVRSAVVVARTPGGEFVAAGRSLREVEKRESALLDIVFAAWALAALGAVPLAASLGSGRTLPS